MRPYNYKVDYEYMWSPSAIYAPSIQKYIGEHTNGPCGKASFTVKWLEYQFWGKWVWQDSTVATSVLVYVKALAWLIVSYLSGKICPSGWEYLQNIRQRIFLLFSQEYLHVFQRLKTVHSHYFKYIYSMNIYNYKYTVHCLWRRETYTHTSPVWISQ